jgi:hypothetical protein
MRIPLRVAACAVIAASAIAPGCGRQNTAHDALATAGNRIIDAEQLERSFQFNPVWKKGMTNLEAHRAQLESLIDSKLFALEAERRGFDADSSMKGYLDFLRQKEMIKELYRREITAKVVVSDEEYRRAYVWMKRRVSFDYVFTRDSARAVRYTNALEQRRAAEIEMQDPRDDLRGSRMDVSYGGVSEELEVPVFSTPLHHAAGPVRIRDGYMSLRVVDGNVDLFRSEQDFAEKKTRIRSILAERKSDSLAMLYISRLMSDKGLALKPEVFWPLAELCAKRVPARPADPFTVAAIRVSSDDVRLLGRDAALLGNSVLATHRDGALTVRDFLYALGTMPGSLRPGVRTPQELKDAVAIIVRNHYLARRAKELWLDQSPRVQSDFAGQRDDALAAFWYQEERRAVTLTQDEIGEFAKHPHPPEERVLYRVSTEDLARQQKWEKLLQDRVRALRSQYAVRVDSVRLASAIARPEEILHDVPMQMFTREVFQ